MPGTGDLDAVVENIVFAGPVIHVHLCAGEQGLQPAVPNDGGHALHAGEMVGVQLPADALRVLSS